MFVELQSLRMEWERRMKQTAYYLSFLLASTIIPAGSVVAASCQNAWKPFFSPDTRITETTGGACKIDATKLIGFGCQPVIESCTRMEGGKGIVISIWQPLCIGELLPGTRQVSEVKLEAYWKEEDLQKNRRSVRLDCGPSLIVVPARPYMGPTHTVVDYFVVSPGQGPSVSNPRARIQEFQSHTGDAVSAPHYLSP